MVENRDFFHTPMHSTPLLGGGGPRRNIAIPFGVEKLEWWATRWWKNVEDMCNHLDRIPSCDGRTDGQTSCHDIIRAMHTRRAVKIVWLCILWTQCVK